MCKILAMRRVPVSVWWVCLVLEVGKHPSEGPRSPSPLSPSPRPWLPEGKV